MNKEDSMQVQLIGGFCDGRIVNIPGDHNVWRVSTPIPHPQVIRGTDPEEITEVTQTVETYRRCIFHCSNGKVVILWMCERVCNKEDIINYYETR